MKKLFLTICLTAMLSTPAIAACEGGTEYTVDGDTFCISSIGLNWWSAANWCKANGMRLVTIYEACPDWDGTTGGGKCGRIFSSDSGYFWTATAYGSEYAFGVFFNDGEVRAALNRNSGFRAACTN